MPPPAAAAEQLEVEVRVADGEPPPRSPSPRYTYRVRGVLTKASAMLPFVRTLWPTMHREESARHDAPVGSAPERPLELRYDVTFREMADRRIKRRFFGTKRASSWFFYCFAGAGLLATLLPFDTGLGPRLSCDNATAAPCFATADPKGDFISISTWALWNIGLNCVVWSGLHAFLSGYWIVRWALYTSVLVDVAAVCVRRGWASLYLDFDSSAAFWLRLAAQACLGVGIASSFGFARWLLPLAIGRGWLWFKDVGRSYRIRQVGPSTYCYRPLWSLRQLWSSRQAAFGYVGEVDEEGRPHGFGRWVDSEPYGESLKGYWRRGVPVGPFLAAEQRSGNGFRSVRIGFATNTVNVDWSRLHTLGLGLVAGRPQAGELRWGVAAVETSINGSFYRHLPDARLVSGPSAAPKGSARWCLGAMPHLSDHEGASSLTVSVAGGAGGGGGAEGGPRLIVSGHEYSQAPGSAAPRSVTVELSTEEDAPDGSPRAAQRAARLRRLNTPAMPPTLAAARGAEQRPPPPPAANGAVRGAVRGSTPAAPPMAAVLRPSADSSADSESVVAPPMLHVPGWQRAGGGTDGLDACREAVVFIHGWQSGLEFALEQFAQFLNLAQSRPNASNPAEPTRTHRTAPVPTRDRHPAPQVPRPRQALRLRLAVRQRRAIVRARARPLHLLHRVARRFCRLPRWPRRGGRP